MIITMPKILTDKLGTDGAEALVRVINESETNSRTDLATKDDIHVLRSEMKDMKSDLLKWIIVMWLAQIGATVALFFKR